MGISYTAVIVVGLPNGEILNRDLIEEDEIQVFAPAYDYNDYGIAGIAVYSTNEYTPDELVWDPDKIANAKEEFKRKTGQEGKVWLSPRGY